jgi:hypothetical protein
VRIDGNTKRRGFFPWMRRFFQQNSVHGSQMRILCGFCANGKKFVRIRLEEKFLSAFKTMKIRMHKLGKVITRQLQKINFHFIAEIP